MSTTTTTMAMTTSTTTKMMMMTAKTPTSSSQPTTTTTTTMTPPTTTTQTISILQKRYRSWGLLFGVAIMLLCCIWGLLNPLSQNYKAFVGAHHQWAHGGELLIAASGTFDYIHFQRPIYYHVLFVTLVLGMFGNGAAYAVAALSGHDWLGSGTEGPNGTPVEREFTIWSVVSLLFVPVITGITCFIAFPLWMVGLYQFQQQQEENDGKRTDSTKKES